jgi:hypothetical protein
VSTTEIIDAAALAAAAAAAGFGYLNLRLQRWAERRAEAAVRREIADSLDLYDEALELIKEPVVYQPALREDPEGHANPAQAHVALLRARARLIGALRGAEPRQFPACRELGFVSIEPGTLASLQELLDDAHAEASGTMAVSEEDRMAQTGPPRDRYAHDNKGLSARLRQPPP